MQDELQRAYMQRREEFRAKWNRDLPFSEMLFDRWERANSLGFGDSTSIYHSSLVYGDVEVGENTWIGPFTLLDGSGVLRIGSNCSISAGVQIYTHDSVKWAVSGGKAEYEFASVSIGDCCFIGPQTVIRKGVSIGSHSVIGACSFVCEDVPDYSIAVGAPCRVRGVVKVNGDGSVSLTYD